MSFLLDILKKILLILRGSLIMAYILTLNVILCTLFFCCYALICLIPTKKWRSKAHQYSLFLYRLLSICTEPALKWHMRVTIINHNAPKCFDYNKSYLMICNHQSWVDIIILGGLIHNRTSLMKVFMKTELLWQLPFASWFCYLNDFPFLKRTQKDQKHDSQTIMDACEAIKKSPSTLMSFVEGTRFSEKKHQKYHSPYQYLLPPKYFGLAVSMKALEDTIEGIIDVTVVYAPRKFGMLDFICGNIQSIQVHYHYIPLDKKLCGDYQNNTDFKQYFKSWLDGIWLDKDELIKKNTLL